MGTPLRSPAFEIESFSPRNESPRPSRRTLHLPGSARGGGSISCPSSASMCGRRTSVPRNRTVPSSTHPRGARLRCSHHGGCTIYGSRSVRTQVSPRWSARYTSSHHRQSGVREGARFTESPPLTANNSRDGARTPCGPHPVPTAESVLHLAGRFFPPGIDHGNHPTVANVSSTALQRSLLGFASPLPRITRGHGPRRTRSSLPVSDVSDRGPTSTRPTIAPHRVTIPGGPRPSPFSVSCRNKGHAPGRPFPSLRSMCREVPLPRVHLALHRLAGRWVSPGRSNRLLDSANGVRATSGPDRDAPLRGDAPHRDSRGKALVPLAADHQSDTGASDSHS